MKGKNSYKELPEGYKLVKEIDAVKDKKFVVLLNIFCVLLTVISGAAVWILKSLVAGNDWFEFEVNILKEPIFQKELFIFIFIVCICAYMILHELVHGLVYKLMTKEKLTFGITLSCAYCGVPNVYVTRKTALLSLMAPFTLFSIIFLLVIFLTNGWVATLSLILFAIHFGGCVGDLYCFIILMTKLRGDILMKDTGPKQTFYAKE